MAFRRFKSATALVAIAMLAQAVPAYAQIAKDQFQQGIAAYEKSDFARAAKLWEPLADEGEVEAMRNLAQLYRLGLGVRKNNRKAFALYKAAADKGLVEAQVNTAFLYLTGEGVDKDPKEAALWFARAADQGDALAQFNLGLMYEKGVGVEQDRELARELYQLAGNQGQVRALARLDALEDSDPLTGTANIGRAEAIAREDMRSPDPTRKPGLAAKPAEKDAPLNDGPSAAEVAAAAKAEADEKAKAEAASREARATVQPRVKDPVQAESELPAADGKPVLIMRRSESAPKAATAETTVTAPRSKGPAMAGKLEKKAESEDASPLRTKAPQPKRQLVSLPAASELPATGVGRNARSASIAQIKRGERAYNEGNFKLALQLIEPLAADGMPIAQFWLGRMYNRGEGVRLDRFEAFSLWRSAASNGSARAATALANLASRFDPLELQSAEAYHARRGQ